MKSSTSSLIIAIVFMMGMLIVTPLPTITKTQNQEAVNLSPANPTISADPEPHPFLRTNQVPNPSFEEADSFGVPTDYGAYSSGHRLANETYTEDVANGTYLPYTDWRFTPYEFYQQVITLPTTLK